jgi:hypothetical protein
LGTASYAESASYSLYAVSASHEITKEVSSSHADTASFAQSGNGTFYGYFYGDLVGDVTASNVYISESLITNNITASNDIYTLGNIIVDGIVDGVDILATSESISTRLTTNEDEIDILQLASSSFAEGINNLQDDSASFSIRLTNEESTGSALINDFDYVQSLGTNDNIIFNNITSSNGLYVSNSIEIDGSFNISSSGDTYFMDTNVGIGTITPSVKLEVSGSISASNNIYTDANLIVTNITASGDIIIDGLVDGVDISDFSSSVENRMLNEEVTSSALINDFDYVQSVGTNDDVTFNSITASGLINNAGVTFSTITISSSYDLTSDYYYIDVDTSTGSVYIQLFDASEVENG